MWKSMFDATIGIFNNNLKYNVFFKFQIDKKNLRHNKGYGGEGVLSENLQPARLCLL